MKAANIIRKHERELGPWFADDEPADVLSDIRGYDPEDAALIALDDVREYLKTRPSAE